MKNSLRIAVSALLACSFAFTAMHVSAASRGQSGSPPKLKHGITLTVWDYFGTDTAGRAERAVETKIIHQWAQATSNHVNTPINTNNNDGKICISGPAGQGADIIGTPHDQVSAMQACGTLAPIPAWAWTPSQKKTYIKAAVQATTLNGKTYAMPWAIETTGLFYNKALISASAFKPAKGEKYLTWSKLIASLKKIDTSSGNLPFGWDPPNFYYDYACISGAGGYVFKFTKHGYDSSKIGLDSAAAIKGITFIKNLGQSGAYKIVPTSMTGATGDGLFAKGKEAIDWTGPWNEATFTAANINYGFAPLPSYDGKHPFRPFSTIQVYSLNKFSKHPNEAASLISYLTKHMQASMFKASGRIPVITSILKSKAVQRAAIGGGLARAALSASPIPNIPEMAQVWTPAGNAIGLVFKGQATPSDAAKIMTAQIKTNIAKAHGG